MKTYVFTVIYIDSNGKQKTRQFKRKDRIGAQRDALDFCRMLDRQIERGRCGGYSMSDC